MKRIQIFFSYAHQDTRLAKQFMIHLALLKRHDFLEFWSEREIRAGDTWETSMSEMLNTAHIILLFITPDFIASTHCYEIEMKRALERHKAGSAHVLPILARPTVDWTQTPLGELQVVPEGGKAAILWTTRDLAWINVAQKITEAIKELTQDTSLTGEQAKSEDAEKSGLTFARKRRTAFSF